MTEEENEKSLEFIRKRAIDLGAVDAKLIPAEKIVVADRVVFKCQLGCEKYGKTLACPPYAPTPSEFRKIVSEYHHALFMKFNSHAQGDPELIKYLAKPDDPSVPPEMKARVEGFWSAWKDDMKHLLETVLELEKAAAEQGYLLAVGLTSGSCHLCEKCNVQNGICVHPAKRRFSEEGVGVDVKATAQNAGVKFTLPFNKNPETFALLLID